MIQNTFDEWIDWSGQPWLEEQYENTVASITQEQRELFPLYNRMLKGELGDSYSNTKGFDE